MRLLLLVHVVTAAMFLTLQPCLAQGQVDFPSAKLSKYLQDSRAKYRDALRIGVSVRDQRSAREVYSYNAAQPLVPASVVKIVTSVAALKMLGGNYRFPTEVFVERKPYALRQRKDKRGVGDVGRLYLRGYGDPSFVREDLLLLARSIKEKGVSKVGDIVADASLFIDARGPLGPRPYEAGISALSLSHNCYEVFAFPTSPGQPALVSFSPGANLELRNSLVTKGAKSKIDYIQSPESAVVAANLKTGVIDAFRDFAFPKVRLTVRGNISEKSDGERSYFTVPSPPLFFVSALKSELEAIGVQVTGSVLLGEVPQEATLLESTKSKDLSLILRDLNFYSNNFIAEQVLYALGQDNVGFFRQELALERLTDFLESVGVDMNSVVLKDGSGLSAENRMSSSALSLVLSYAANDFTISPDFISSLSRFGKTGTLKKRVLGKKENRRSFFLEGGPAHSVWGKTGTLSGVSSLAGFVEASNKSRYSYTILINGTLSKESSSIIEDAIVKIIAGV